MKLGRNTGLALAAGLIIAGGITAVHGHGGRGMGFGGGFGHHAMHWFAKADVNDDGAISLDEVREMRGKRFAKFDLNADGVVDKKEIEERIRVRVERMATRLTRRFDKDGDGRITKAEFDAPAIERFKWNDLDEDGKISGDELPRRMKRGSHHR